MQTKKGGPTRGRRKLTRKQHLTEGEIVKRFRGLILVLTISPVVLRCSHDSYASRIKLSQTPLGCPQRNCRAHRGEGILKGTYALL